MTAKELMLEVLRRLPEDVSVDQAIEKLYLVRQVEIGLQQADAGDVMDHDEFVRELELEN